MKVICLFSGGIDSTTLLYDLLAEENEVIALSFDYGQTHVRELQYAARTAKICNVRHITAKLPFLGDVSSTSQLLGGMGGPIVPSRNAIMLSSAWAFAESYGASAVAIGAHATDDSGFPDCREGFFASLEHALQAGSATDIQLLRPFVHMSKRQVVELGAKLGVKFSQTYTCYVGGEEPCGVCASCIGRLNCGY